ncbi:MAG: hypothetical protein L3K25_19775 [Gammaproteobacteria bacterium]|nr:hypothetical protein [Gammaproteobacteria bacterium]
MKNPKNKKRSIIRPGLDEFIALHQPATKLRFSHKQVLQDLMRSRIIPLLQLSTDDDVANVLRGHFGGRATPPVQNPPQETAA